MCTVKSLLLNTDQNQKTPRPSVLNIASLLCPEPELPVSYNQDMNNVEKYQKSYQDVSSKVNLWHYNQYNQQIVREPYSIQYPTPYNSTSIDSSKISEDGDGENTKLLKTKRRRISSQQLVVLNNAFERTFFPSTQVRVDLARQLGMRPRTVQIWFQNKRQSMRSKQRPGSSPSRQMSMVE